MDPISHTIFPDAWIEFDLEGERLVAGVATKGRFNYDNWVTFYRVMYQADNGEWIDVEDGNGTPEV